MGGICGCNTRFALPVVQIWSRDTHGGSTRVDFAVRGFDPRLRVLVSVFYQASHATGDEWPLTEDPAQPNQWTAAPFVVDGSGQRRRMQCLTWGVGGDIFRRLPIAVPTTGEAAFSDARPDGDAYEFVTAAEGIAFAVDLNLGFGGDTPSEFRGLWLARVDACALPGVPDDTAQALFKRLALETPST